MTRVGKFPKDRAFLSGLSTCVLVAALIVGAFAAWGLAHPGFFSRGASHAIAHPKRVARFPHGREVAFVGDSYSWGAEASSPQRRWTTLLCTRRGWNETNVAIPGMGYVVGVPGRDYHGQMREAARAHPSLVVMSGGWNDVANRESVPTILHGLRGALQEAKRAMPNTRVVVVAPIGPATTPPLGLVRLRDEAGPVVRAAGATYVDLDFPLTGHPEWISADHVHPNDAGHARLAELTAARLPRP